MVISPLAVSLGTHTRSCCIDSHQEGGEQTLDASLRCIHACLFDRPLTIELSGQGPCVATSSSAGSHRRSWAGPTQTCHLQGIRPLWCQGPHVGTSSCQGQGPRVALGISPQTARSHQGSSSVGRTPAAPGATAVIHYPVVLSLNHPAGDATGGTT
jgi:hypothetical protein